MNCSKTCPSFLLKPPFNHSLINICIKRPIGAIMHCHPLQQSFSLGKLAQCCSYGNLTYPVTESHHKMGKTAEPSAFRMPVWGQHAVLIKCLSLRRPCSCNEFHTSRFLTLKQILDNSQREGMQKRNTVLRLHPLFAFAFFFLNVYNKRELTILHLLSNT